MPYEFAAEILDAEESLEEAFSEIPADSKPSDRFFLPPSRKKFAGTSQEAKFIYAVLEAYEMFYERARINSVFVSEYVHLLDTKESSYSGLSADNMKHFRDKVLHALRTEYAHYLNPSENRSNIIHGQCEIWYSEILGGKLLPEDETEYELCTRALLQEISAWLDFAKRIIQKITVLNDKLIYSQWFIKAKHNLLPFRKINILQEAAKKLSIPYDAEAVYKYHQKEFDEKIRLLDVNRPDYIQCVERELTYAVLTLSEYPMPEISQELIKIFELDSKCLREIIPAVKKYYQDQQNHQNILSRQELINYAEDLFKLKRR